MDSRGFAVTFAEQIAIALAQLLDTFPQGIAPTVELVVGQLGLRFNEQQVQVVGEVQPLPTPPAQKGGYLEPRDPARPREEAPLAIEIGKLPPEDQGGLLEQIVGIVQIPDQGMDVPIQARLVLAQIRR
jgi:hypothetical protein